MNPIITATLDWAALSAAPCGVCQTLLTPLAGSYRVDLGCDGQEEFLVFTPRLTPEQVKIARPHRDCLLATVITLTTPQLILIEHQEADGTWTQFELRIHSTARAAGAWSGMVKRLEEEADVPVRATWLSAGVPQAHYPE